MGDGAIALGPASLPQEMERHGMQDSEDYFAQALEFIKNSQVEPVVKNDQVIRLIEATGGVSGDSIDRLVQTSFVDETSLSVIRAIESLDIAPEEKLAQLVDIAKASSFNRMHNIDLLMNLVAALKGKPLHPDE